MRFNQPLTGPGGLENWHPRDVDVLRVKVQDEQDQAADARFAAERRRIWGG